MDAPARAAALPALALAALLLPPSPLSADILRLRDGGSLRGRVTHQAETVTVETPAWKAVIPRERVLSIETEPDPVEEYARRRAALPATPDAGDWAALGAWCAANGLDGQAREAWGEAVRIDPDHEAARRALGFVRWQDRWVTKDEFHAARGEVTFRGRWMPREEMAALLDAEKAAREARELADRSEREKRDAKDAERRIRDDADVADAAARRAELEARLREREILVEQEAMAARLGTPWIGSTYLHTGSWGYPYLGPVGGYPPCRYPVRPTPYACGGWAPGGFYVYPGGFRIGGTWGCDSHHGTLRVGGSLHGTGSSITIRR